MCGKIYWAAIAKKNHQTRANPALIYDVDNNTGRVQKQAERDEKREEEL